MLALAKLLDHAVPIVVDVDADDLVARHHDVLHGGILEIQYADQHLLVAVRNHRSGLRDHRAQLFAAQGIRGLLRRYAEQTQHPVGQEIGGPDEGVEQKQQRCVDVSGRQRQAFGVQRAEGLGRHFAEDEQHQGQGGRSESDREFPAQPERDEADQHRRRHVHEGAQQ